MDSHNPVMPSKIGEHPHLTFLIVEGTLDAVTQMLPDELNVYEAVESSIAWPIDRGSENRPATGEWKGTSIGYRPLEIFGNRFGADSPLGVLGHGKEAYVQLSVTYPSTKNAAVNKAYVDSIKSQGTAAKKDPVGAAKAFA